MSDLIDAQRRAAEGAHDYKEAELITVDVDRAIKGFTEREQNYGKAFQEQNRRILEDISHEMSDTVITNNRCLIRLALMPMVKIKGLVQEFPQFEVPSKMQVQGARTGIMKSLDYPHVPVGVVVAAGETPEDDDDIASRKNSNVNFLRVGDLVVLAPGVLGYSFSEGGNDQWLNTQYRSPFDITEYYGAVSTKSRNFGVGWYFQTDVIAKIDADKFIELSTTYAGQRVDTTEPTGEPETQKSEDE